MIFLTDFADQAVVVPIVLAVAAILLIRGQRRVAFLWLGVIGATLMAVGTLKLAFLGCSQTFDSLSIRSPSGHTAAASVVAGGLAILLTGRHTIILVVATSAASVIGLSRVVLGCHSVPEVVLGATVGLIGTEILSRLWPPGQRRRPASILVIAGLVAVAMHGVHLPAEAALWRASKTLLHDVELCRLD
jgi:membrane-associated phospholipid phosphatase